MSQTGRRKFAAHASRHRRRNRIAVFIPARSSSTSIRARASVHGHGRVSVCITRPARSATGARRANAGISCFVRRIQRSPVVVAPAAPVLTVGFLTLHLKSGILRGLGGVSVSAVAHRRGTVGSGELVRKHTLLAEGFVVVCAVHVGVLGNTLFARLPADKRTAHRAGHDAGCNNKDGSREHDPATPFHVWDEQQDVHQESQESDEQGWDGKDQESQEEARRVSRGVEVSGHGEREADQDEQCCNRMYDKNRGQTRASRRGQGEVIGVVAREEAICERERETVSECTSQASMSPDNDDIFQRHLPMTSSNAVLQRHPPTPSFNDIFRRRPPTPSRTSLAYPLCIRSAGLRICFHCTSQTPRNHSLGNCPTEWP
jgi:hypothetical protein